MGESTKKKVGAILALAMSLIVGVFTVLGIQRAQANTEKKEAVSYAKVDTESKVMLTDHARRLTGHDAMFLANSEEHREISSQLNIYSQTQNAIKQAQASLKETQDRMETSQGKFQTEMRTDIKRLITETSKANSWITNIENIKGL